MLKYVNFTKLDHLESILINVSAFLEENYYFTSKNAPKIVDSAEKSCTTKILSWKSCESCTISVVISNPDLNNKIERTVIAIHSLYEFVISSLLHSFWNVHGWSCETIEYLAFAHFQPFNQLFIFHKLTA